jgi:hypothetical protein
MALDAVRLIQLDVAMKLVVSTFLNASIEPFQNKDGVGRDDALPVPAATTEAVSQIISAHLCSRESSSFCQAETLPEVDDSTISSQAHAPSSMNRHAEPVMQHEPANPPDARGTPELRPKFHLDWTLV